MQTSQVIVYTSNTYDLGSRSGTWEAILRFDKQDKKLGGRVMEVSASRLELLTVINVLRKLPHNIHIIFHTHSGYIYTGVTQQLDKWESKDWQVDDVDDLDLWQELSKKRRAIVQLNWQWDGQPSSEAHSTELQAEFDTAQQIAQEHRQSLNREIELSSLSLQKSQQSHAEQDKIADQLRGQVVKLTSTIAQLKRDKATLSKDIAELSAQHQELQEKVQLEVSRSERVKQLDQEVTALSLEVSRLTVLRMETQKQKDDLDVAIVTLSKQQTDLTKTNTTLKKDVDRMKKQTEDLRTLEKEYAKQNQALSVLNTQLQAAQGKNFELIAERQRLESQVAELKKQSDQHAVTPQNVQSDSIPQKLPDWVRQQKTH